MPEIRYAPLNLFYAHYFILPASRGESHGVCFLREGGPLQELVCGYGDCKKGRHMVMSTLNTREPDDKLC